MDAIKKREDTLFERISSLIEEARKRIVTTVNVAEVYTKYGIGQYIVEYEQQGEQRAKYGKAVLKNLSIRLTDKYGEGWSVETLDKCRKFYRVFSSSGISSTMQTKLTRGIIMSQEMISSVCQIHLLHLHCPGRTTLSLCALRIPMPVVSMR